jgi:hypothetical protein
MSPGFLPGGVPCAKNTRGFSCALPAVSRRSRNAVSKSARFPAGLREGCVSKTRGFPAADRCIRNLFQPGTRGLDRANHWGRLAAASLLLLLLDTAP